MLALIGKGEQGGRYGGTIDGGAEVCIVCGFSDIFHFKLNSHFQLNLGKMNRRGQRQNKSNTMKLIRSRLSDFLFRDITRCPQIQEIGQLCT